MAVYLVERTLPGITTDQLAAAQKKAIQVGIELTAEGKAVRYIRSTFIPGEHICMCLFEAPNSEHVREANERAEIPFTRIVAAEDLTPQGGAEARQIATTAISRPEAATSRSMSSGSLVRIDLTPDMREDSERDFGG